MNDNLIIKQANIVNPASGTMERGTLYIEAGKLTDTLPEDSATVIDGKNLWAAPGFVDSHAHVFTGSAVISIPADQIGVQQGVLTVVDAGSTGIRDFAEFNKDIIEKSETDVYFFLNIARGGLCDGLQELGDKDNLMTGDELENFIKQHGERLVGLKVRMSGSVLNGSGVAPLKHARMLSDRARLPLCIHIGNPPPALDEILNLLKSGDIVTHSFHGKPGGLADYPTEFRAAAERGVHFDLGHGAASFSLDAMPRVLETCPIDFTISTDLYDKNFLSPVGSLANTMSKLFPLRYTVIDLVRRVTTLPRTYLGLPSRELKPGEPADITLFSLVSGRQDLVDSEGKKIVISQVIKPEASIKKGRKVWADGI